MALGRRTHRPRRQRALGAQRFVGPVGFDFALVDPSLLIALDARIGDTLESIANAIFPRNRAAKKSYIEALRALGDPRLHIGDFGETVVVDWGLDY